MVILVEQMPYLSCISMISPHSNCLRMLIFRANLSSFSLVILLIVFPMPSTFNLQYKICCLFFIQFKRSSKNTLNSLCLSDSGIGMFFSIVHICQRLIKDSRSKWSLFVLQSWKQEYEWSLKNFLFVISTFHQNASNTTSPVC